MIKELEIIGRSKLLFENDIKNLSNELNSKVEESSFLVIGGAGTIGQAVTKEIFKRNPKTLHVVDISENNLAELIRDIRSSDGYIDGEFGTFVIDIASSEFTAFMRKGVKYNYILNLSALKHVRSEKDPYTLMRMIEVNILNTIKSIDLAIENGCKKYFCVSTDKAANPVNMMGASKRIMELFLMLKGKDIAISTARFANVAFSDGSLLYGFRRRLEKFQPIAGPDDIKRYFVIAQESGELCLLSCLFGENKDVFFPKLTEELDLVNIKDVAENYLKSIEKTPLYCNSEQEARDKIGKCDKNQWPCYFSQSDTTGEKGFEEFYTANEKVDLDSFNGIGVVKSNLLIESSKLGDFLKSITWMRESGIWAKEDIVKLFKELLPEFVHEEKGKFLDQKM